MPGRIYLSPPHLCGEERRLVEEAFASNWVAPVGPQLEAFEREVCAAVGVGHAVALSSGTAALHLALVLLGVGPGDVVGVPSLTFVASANPVRYVGAEPVFIDSERGSWNLDPDRLAEWLEGRRRAGQPRPAAVVAVDLYGQCADYGRIVEICRREEVPLVEDAAEALGASWGGRPAGGFGRLGVFSFNGNKIITTGGGGMLVSDDADLVERARFLAAQARDPAVHYQHSQLGFNYRMSNVLAALGRGQLSVLDDRVRARRGHFEAYREALGDLPGVAFQPEAAGGRSNRWLTCLTIDPAAAGTTAGAVVEAMGAEDIECRPVWKPLHLQPLYRGAAAVGGAVAEDLYQRGLCLPSGSGLTPGERGRVVAVFRRCFSP